MADKEVLIGVAGGIAAYKSAALVSQLVQSEVAVTVVMTASATEFVGPPTFSALSGRPVATRIFDDTQFPLGAHITLSHRAKLLCVAPATANFLAKAAHGIADDLLSTLYLCFRGTILMAPAMNSEMWAQPAVQRNVQQLRGDGVHIIDPEGGWLSCRQQGVGRMASPECIVEMIRQHLGS
jgi:phosphopantothenoylcysteine decarboxylase/phosphopantothenate--cysteine ligase